MGVDSERGDKEVRQPVVDGSPAASAVGALEDTAVYCSAVERARVTGVDGERCDRSSSAGRDIYYRPVLAGLQLPPPSVLLKTPGIVPA